MTTLIKGLHSQMSGRYRIEIINSRTGKVKQKLEFDNLITNIGLDRYGDAPYINNIINSSVTIGCVQLGVGTSIPQPTDTALSNFLVGTLRTSTSVSYSGAPDYYTEATMFFQFPAGAFNNQNLTEIGVGFQGSGTVVSGNLFSRSLILDGNGNPTSITILSDEVLSIYYYLRTYPPIVDTVGTISISGVTYDYTLRACSVATSIWGISHYNFFYGLQNSSIIAYTGDIGSITSVPGGTTITLGTGTPSSSTWFSTYTPGSYTRDLYFQAQINSFNLSGGIRSIAFRSGHGGFQIQFSPNIPKNSNNVLTLGLRYSWGRRV